MDPVLNLRRITFNCLVCTQTIEGEGLQASYWLRSIRRYYLSTTHFDECSETYETSRLTKSGADVQLNTPTQRMYESGCLLFHGVEADMII